MIGINDHIYLSPAWAPGAGEPYMVARVMEFVTAASSRSGAAALASSSGTLQVRANVFLRMRDISLRSTNDPRLLVATMHSDVFSLENVRGICEVRHRDLIGSGTAPDVTQWKKKEDHFYYYQLYDRYIHRFYDVVPTEKVQNAPPEVLTTLRTRYSFVVAETGMINDLTDALRGCAVCHRWASGPESVRCDTCKKFFHMKCLNPPLVSKPAKGYSWTCAPCSRRHEQDVELTLHTGGQLMSASSSANGGTSNSQPRYQITAVANRGRGAPRGRVRQSLIRRGTAGRGDDLVSASNTPDSSPVPEKTNDDIRGTRCFNRWPYRYFGQHTNAMDVLDPHDSVYPIATTRLGPKYQASLPTWEEQQEAGLGVHCRTKEKIKEDEAAATAAATGEEAALSASAVQPSAPPTNSHKKKGRPFKRKREAAERSDTPTTGTSTPAAAPIPLSTEDPEFERGGDTSVEAIFLPSMPENEQVLNAYVQAVQSHFKTVPPHHVDLLNRTLKTFTEKEGDPVQALMSMSASTTKQLRIDHWTSKEAKQFDSGIAQVNSDMKQLKKFIPSKKVAEIVRYFAVWKMARIKADFEASQQHQQQQPVKAASTGSKKDRANGANRPSSTATAPAAPKPTTSRAVSPSLSVYGDDAPSGPATACAMCSTTSSRIWYKGPASLANRVLCVNCGIYWRKYAAETFNPDLVSVNTRNKSNTAVAAAANASGVSEDGLGVAPPSKLARTSRDGKGSTPGTSPAPAAPPPVPRPEPLKCVMCKRIEPKKKLAQCRQCSLSVHQGCYGLTDAEIEMDVWMCDPCNNEQTQESALLPRCILCSTAAQEDSAANSAKHAAAAGGGEGKARGRPKASAVAAEDAVKRETASTPIAANVIKAPLGALDAFKPTECNNWAHVLCSVFIPEVVYSDTTRLKTVESCGNLPTWRYESLCCICNTPRGACVSCSEPNCRKTFHVSCAHNQQGYTLAFEIIPVKSTRREVIPTLTFKGETGHMVPQLWCRDHKEVAKSKKLYDLAEVDQKSGLTSLQMFVRANKNLNEGSGAGEYALLRRAKRYDSLLGGWVAEGSPVAGNKSLTGDGEGKKSKCCVGCRTAFSPFWWKLPPPSTSTAGGDAQADALGVKAESTQIQLSSTTKKQGDLCCNYCKQTRYQDRFVDV
ncbi:potential Snt2p-like DNA binding protein [Pseudozyma hubeiensis SY62]|uniref:Potential Snt2p-like DNA binding protein n=1 Tax=Pseudozyma hubeiensis (strain SY62) TaxID=1305764 RepID=R9P205_PSEHS|nr:potential Snt2p-like DNA binding protein [Pseudozyma hubeiensis SY62]GAC95348.1 potential Snt2p-like DNA binding protein [Pseudozyma hubeiensis SY62]